MEVKGGPVSKNDVLNYNKERLRSKLKSLREKCKRCKGLMYQNGYSEIPGICKRCGEHIYE